ncbi:helix-turn-helix domain-containing protein [Croceimicrobium sp.]|uniref:AraC family transcriptional regulator n=1 Tax=Croceimicrobium sp. TaxID=2828340 RepID=UPI003BA9AB3A
MRRLQWAEYSKVLRDNTLHQERFESANDLFLSEYRGFFEEPGLGRIDVSSVRGIGHYTIKKTRAILKDEVELEMKLDEPLFTVGFLYSGSFVFHGGDVNKGRRVDAPSVVVYRQNDHISYQRIYCEQPYETLNISFNDQVLQRILQKFENSGRVAKRLNEESMIAIRPEDEYLGAYFDKLNIIPLDQDVNNLFLAESLVLRILNKTMLFLERPASGLLGEQEREYRTSSALFEVLAYMRENLHKPISLTRVAEQFGVSSRWLQRRFKEDLQSSFSDYLRDMRLQRAYDLLTNNEQALSVREVCLEVGYSSSQTFSSNFRKRFNVSPKQVMSVGL